MENWKFKCHLITRSYLIFHISQISLASNDQCLPTKYLLKHVFSHQILQFQSCFKSIIAFELFPPEFVSLLIKKLVCPWYIFCFWVWRRLFIPVVTGDVDPPLVGVVRLAPTSSLYLVLTFWDRICITGLTWVRISYLNIFTMSKLHIGCQSQWLQDWWSGISRLLPTFNEFFTEESVTVNMLLHNVKVFSSAWGTDSGVTYLTTVVSYEIKCFLHAWWVRYFEGNINWHWCLIVRPWKIMWKWWFLSFAYFVASSSSVCISAYRFWFSHNIPEPVDCGR